MNKDNLTIEDLMTFSSELHDKYKDSWEPMEPEFARNSILYMIEEIGEVIAVIKKKTVDDIMHNETVRQHLVEEFTDIMMYFTDALNRFKITPEEFSNAYAKKFEKNMNRDFHQEHKDFIES